MPNSQPSHRYARNSGLGGFRDHALHPAGPDFKSGKGVSGTPDTNTQENMAETL